MKKVKFISLVLSVLICFVVKAQEKTITGIVSDDSGPLPGVNINVQKSTSFTITDFDGKYTIKAKKGNILVFRFSGLKTENIAIEKTIIDLKMKDSLEVFAIPVPCYYSGNQKKRISNKPSENIPVETVLTTRSKDTIQDVKVSSNFIKPANPSNRIIICAPSIKSVMNEPLYILDGKILNTKEFSKINPNDIESIKILKGIEATSVYGNKAINGVVVIETKNND